MPLPHTEEPAFERKVLEARELRLPPRNQGKDSGAVAELKVPDAAQGIVLIVQALKNDLAGQSESDDAFIHYLNQSGYATLSTRLASEGSVQYFLELLEKLDEDPRLSDLPLGIYASGAMAPTAIRMSLENHARVGALVLKSGLFDPASGILIKAESPTLLVVGDRDSDAVIANRRALLEMACKRALVLIPGTARAFQEPGSLWELSRVTLSWFERFLSPIRSANDASAEPDPSLSL